MSVTTDNFLLPSTFCSSKLPASNILQGNIGLFFPHYIFDFSELRADGWDVQTGSNRILRYLNRTKPQSSRFLTCSSFGG